MFDASQWAERIVRDAPSTSRPAKSPNGGQPDRSEVSRLIRSELAAFRKEFEDQLYQDISEAIPAHIKHELRRMEGAN